MTKQIFLSYSSESRDQVHGLAEDLSKNGHEVWLDRYQLGPKEENWSKTIYKSISNCDLFILFSSPSALKSEWVRLECAAAVALKKRRFLVELKNSAPIHEELGYWWDKNYRISCCDLKFGDKGSSDWNRFILQLSQDTVYKNGMPLQALNQNDWSALWKRFHCPKGDIAWVQHQNNPGHVRDLDELEDILMFFTTAEPDKEMAANHIIVFLKTYSYNRLKRYQKWYDFVSRPETHLSRKILMDTPHHFSMRMTALDPGPVLSMFKRFDQDGLDHNMAWIHAVMACYGAMYEEKT